MFLRGARLRRLMHRDRKYLVLELLKACARAERWGTQGMGCTEPSDTQILDSSPAEIFFIVDDINLGYK